MGPDLRRGGINFRSPRENLSPAHCTAPIMPCMSRDDILRFYGATPVWFWPVLWWNLLYFRRWVLTLDHTQAFLFRIHTDGRGRIRIEWIAAPVRPLQYDLSYTRPRTHDLADLDLQSRLIEYQDRAGIIAFAGSGACMSREGECFATLEPG